MIRTSPVETKFQFTLSWCCALTLLIAAIWYEVLPNLATVRVITTSWGDKGLRSTMLQPYRSFTAPKITDDCEFPSLEDCGPGHLRNRPFAYWRPPRRALGH